MHCNVPPSSFSSASSCGFWHLPPQCRLPVTNILGHLGQMDPTIEFVMPCSRPGNGRTPVTHLTAILHLRPLAHLSPRLVKAFLATRQNTLIMQRDVRACQPFALLVGCCASSAHAPWPRGACQGQRAILLSNVNTQPRTHPFIPRTRA